MFTREELEDLWNNKPYGEFTRLKKERKGKRKYLLTCTAYKRITVTSMSTEVYAKDPYEARSNHENSLRMRMQQTLRTEHNIDTWDSTVSYQYTVAQL